MSDTVAPVASLMRIARVAVPSPLRRSFDYLLPETLIADFPDLAPGVRLRVPFGTRELTAILLELDTRSDLPADKLKPVSEILDPTPLIPAHLLKLWCWAARYYQHPIGDALHTLLPAGLRGSAQAVTKRRAKDKKPDHSGWETESAHTLNSEQQRACVQIKHALGRYQGFLLDGVTGSGKTEVYLQAINEVLERGEQALVLVPEISLTPQTVARFRQRFATDIAVMHSGLTARQRLNAWLAASSGEAGIVIGTRSAVFTPLARPGLIVIDEEHDGSFKQQDGFRYSARDLAVMRASTENIPVVLGSATPSLESLQNALNGRYQHLILRERAGESSLPAFQLIDTTHASMEHGFSETMLLCMQQHLRAGNQVLVFINRRGFAPVLQCNDCGWIAECKHCDARLTLHRTPPHLCCHHCERKQPLMNSCPSCHGKYLAPVGTGTERSESFLQSRFPGIPVWRVDRDSTRRKDELDRVLANVQTGEPCILVGTQMLAKGHHFPSVTLVAVLDADNGLFSADFRGQEFMAQLLIQVAGRAGRAGSAGEVLVQTRHASHENLQLLISQGYHALAERLLTERRQTSMPPVTSMATLRAEAVSANAPRDFLLQARNMIDDYCQRTGLQERILVNGPLPAPMEKRANRFRQQLHVRAWQRQDIQQLLSEICLRLEQLPTQRNVRWSVDVDPLDMI
ncbi:MAG TPA: primosomal protein N' [Pseudohongiella sp.]|nr:primosomal protein N' [Pseudohongiella sp.]